MQEEQKVNLIKEKMRRQFNSALQNESIDRSSKKRSSVDLKKVE